MNQKYMRVGIPVANKIMVVLIGGVIVEQGPAGKFASSTNITSAWAPIDIWYENSLINNTAYRFDF